MSYLKNKKEQINNEINILEERIKKLIVEANNCLVNSYNVVMYKKFISFVMMSMITCIFASDLKNILSFLPLNLIPTGIIGIDLIGSALINKIVLKNNKKINFVQNIKRYIVVRSEQAKLVSKKIINQKLLKNLDNELDYENVNNNNNYEKEIYELENINNKEIEKKSINRSLKEITKEINNSPKLVLGTTIVSLITGNFAFISDTMPSLLALLAPALLTNIVCAKEILNLRKINNQAIEEVKSENPNINSDYNEEDILERENKITLLKLKYLMEKNKLESIKNNKKDEGKELLVSNDIIKEDTLKLVREK